MTSYSINLKSVYSCPAVDVPSEIKLPKNWTLGWHQVETWKAIQDPEVDVILNYAMTGDGKSLSAYLDSLQGEKPDGLVRYAMGLYPTNELARDQEKQIQGYIEEFQPNNDPRVTRLTSATLEIYAENYGTTKASAIATKVEQSEIIVTNPDIQHYLHRNVYLTPQDAPDKLWSPLDAKFQLIIHDEFHVLNTPQIAGTLNTLLLTRHTKRHHKHLFLSATPETGLTERLEKVGVRCKVINPYEQGKYRFPESYQEKQQLELQGWRQVARPITLHFIPLGSSHGTSQVWLWENRELIRSYFLEHPGTKGAIILESIATVKILTAKFKQFLHPITVEENTGLTGQTGKNQSLEADLVFGTSTIDVGVDFKINFLIFESGNSGSFIQRLGRLGRHDGYNRNGETIEFTHFTAYALTPNYLVERMFLGDNPSLEIQGVYDRPFFHQQIQDKYRKINDFQGYYSRWGSVQSVAIVHQLSHKTIKNQYSGSREAFAKDCEIVFNASLARAKGCIHRWSQEWQELSQNTTGNPIAEDAISFRGSSSLSCGLYDLTEGYEVDRFKTYDLPGILGNLHIEPMTKEEYLKLLQDTQQRFQQPIPQRRFEYCLGFMKLQGYREERLNWRFSYGGDLDSIANSWRVQVLLGVQVYQPGNPWVNKINQRIKARGLVTYVVPHPVEEVRRRLYLPLHFQIYAIDHQGRDKYTAPYSISFGQSALLLDTLACRLKGKVGGSWIC